MMVLLRHSPTVAMLQQTIVGHIPPDTLSIARTALRDRNPYVRLRDQMGSIFDDGMFAHLGRFRSPNYSHAAIARRDGHQE